MNRIVKYFRTAGSFFFTAMVFLYSCQSNPEPSDSTIVEFQEMAQKYQRLYMGGSANCEYILKAMHEDIKFSENGTKWSYSDLHHYCPNLPKKAVSLKISRF